MHLSDFVEHFHTNKMEIQTPMLHHNPYEIVKSETPTTPPKGLDKNPYLDQTSEMIFSNFQLQPSFCAPVNNNNSEPLNNNHTKTNPNGRALAADRKRPYPCNLCPSRFGSKMELEEHQNSHTGMKPFECDVCKARFNRRSTLWNHKRIHSDAKPFVCTVCQMTFKWKNSLKCHKDMHQRKNETSAHLDTDLRQLTYATAAKRKLMMDQDDGGVNQASSTNAQPLITTTTPKKKKNNSHSFKQNNSVPSSMSNVHLNSIQPLQASALLHQQNDHQLDIDSHSIDSLVVHNNSNLLMQIYGDIDGLAPRHASSMLSGIEENSMLQNPLITEIKQEPNSSVPLNMHLPMQINMLNFRPISAQQLPSVHHLTSASLPSVSGNMDYGIPSEAQNNIQHQQYIVTSQSDMMLNQQQLNNYQQQQQDNCVIVSAGEYVPNFDYNLMSNQYQMSNQEQQDQHQEIIDEKVLPYEQW